MAPELKILTAWCEFLSGPDSRYVSNDSRSGSGCHVAKGEEPGCFRFGGSTPLPGLPPGRDR
jgi:hypothetical protein